MGVQWVPYLNPANHIEDLSMQYMERHIDMVLANMRSDTIGDWPWRHYVVRGDY